VYELEKRNNHSTSQPDGGISEKGPTGEPHKESSVR